MPTKQPSWEELRERFKVKRFNHQKAHSLDGPRAGVAKEHFSLRCAEIGFHHHSAGSYFLRYVQGSLRRKNNRRVSHGDQVSRIAANRDEARPT